MLTDEKACSDTGLPQLCYSLTRGAVVCASKWLAGPTKPIQTVSHTTLDFKFYVWMILVFKQSDAYIISVWLNLPDRCKKGQLMIFFKADDLRSRVLTELSQATGLDAMASRVKCPAEFMSHWYGISFTGYVFECYCFSYHYGQTPPYFVILVNDNNNDDDYDYDNKNNNNDKFDIWREASMVRSSGIYFLSIKGLNSKPILVFSQMLLISSM